MSANTTSWTDLNFIERQMIPIMDVGTVQGGQFQPKWLEYQDGGIEHKWAQEANTITMDFGGVFHSIFLRWAVSVNGLQIASEKYSSPEWLESGKAFAIIGIRNRPDGSGPAQTYVRTWEGAFASKVHESSMPMLAAWGFCNLYACLEEFIFKLFRTYLEHNPLNICKGDEFSDLRKAYKARDQSEQHLENWNVLWKERLDAWHRKKLYDGIERVFNNFIQQSGLSIPVAYEGDHDYCTYAKTLGGIAMIRNCFIHGATGVSQELADFCSSNARMFFHYEKGQNFAITLHELATFEYFTDVFTQTLNLSFYELMVPGGREAHRRMLKDSERT
ncbi:hypothetical protein LMG1866_04619 [Achromobacter ruhlandii]|uniref:hypothetical protein n=1 Tax=Achromobacter ruhlandii TaxID=72557 RepID=UPI0014655336|nr:hypothetical protein [Achromobacter ruhlandii]CAB3730760.1 hypothetical protein LMG1866_04619 [Achromobacter ruhlandii]